MCMAGTSTTTQSEAIYAELVRIMTSYHVTATEAGQVFALCVAQDCHQQGWSRREIDSMVRDIGRVARTIPTVNTT
jgi:hypothetical protein